MQVQLHHLVDEDIEEISVGGARVTNAPSFSFPIVGVQHEGAENQRSSQSFLCQIRM